MHSRGEIKLKNILNITIREIKSYFITPLGYVVFFIFFLLSNLNSVIRIIRYANYNLQLQNQPQISQAVDVHTAVIQSIFAFSCYLILFLAPAITMKLISEEKRSGSLELLLTSPVSITEILLGKYLAAMSFLFLVLVLSFWPIFLLFIWGTPPLLTTLTGFLGVILFASAVLSFSLFASCLTDSQGTAFFIGAGGALFFFILWIISESSSAYIGEIASYLSILTHVKAFVKGLFTIKHTVYYVSFISFFIYLSYRKLESYLWRS